MRKVCFNKSTDSCIYIDKMENAIVVITKGVTNPFDYLHALNKCIFGISDKINSNIIEVYFDMLSCVGDRINRFGKLSFDAKSSCIDFLSFHTISKDSMPNEVVEYLRNFYTTHDGIISQFSILTQSEKTRLKNNAL